MPGARASEGAFDTDRASVARGHLPDLAIRHHDGARVRRRVLESPAAGLATSGLVLSRLALPATPQPGVAGAGDVFTTGAVQIRPTPS